MHILKQWRQRYLEGDIEIAQIIQTQDETYQQGIKFSFLYLRYEPSSDGYIPAIAIDNSHGKAHIHYLGKKVIPVDYGWMQALGKFERLVDEYRKRNRLL